jgi:dephospho-CoA kinase
MFRVALTGNIASGKSAVASVWMRQGAHILDADELARLAVLPGSPALARIVEEFGPVLTPDGHLDRAALRRLVFADEQKRLRLEAILHPEILRLRELEEERLHQSGVHLVVHVIPLLFEVGLEHAFDVVVLVDAPEAVRRQRLEARGIDRDEALRIMSAQWPAADKRAGSTIVIENDGTIADLERNAEAVWHEILRLAERKT